MDKGFNAVDRSLSVSGGREKRLRLLFSCGSRHQARDSEQVVGSGDQASVHLRSFASTVASFAQAADGLHPTERVLDPFADPLADRVARMAHGAGIKRGAAPTPPVLGHARSDLERTAVGHKIVGVVTLVAAQRDPAGRFVSAAVDCDHPIP
jgi:hypothetical protein